MDPPAPKFDEQQYVERLEPGSLDGEEVARDDPLRLRSEELRPTGSGPPRGRAESRSPEQGSNRRGRYPDPELRELAFDPHAPPPRFLYCYLEHELSHLRIDRRTARLTPPAVRPLLPHELAVPAEE